MSKRHEQLLFHYSSALERGDFDAVADVLREAEHDPALEQMILDMNDAYAAERFNHMNPKENPMLAALYQNPYRTQRSRVHWQSLPFIAALAVIALLSVMLAVETRGSTPMNTSGDNSTAVAQTSPYCSGVLVSSFTTIPLRSRPASDAPVVTELVHERNAGREIVVQDRVTVDGEAWVFVRVPSSPDVPFGWITEAEFGTMVADCQPLVDGIAQRPLLVATVDMNATIVPPVITSTPLPAIAQHPLFVVTQPSADAFVTVVPGNVMPLSTFTATPVPFVIEPSLLPPTVVSPDVVSASATPALLAVDDAASCETVSDPGVAWLTLYSRPTTTSIVVASLAGRYDVNDLIVKDSTEVDGQKWFYISTGSYSGMPQGWVTEADFNHAVNCFRQNPAWQPTMVPPEPDSQGVAIAATNLASYGAGGFCKTTTLRTAEVRAFPQGDSAVVATLPEDTLVSVGAFATSTDAQGNSLRWHVVGFEDIRGWMPVNLLDMSACPQAFDTSADAPSTQAAATRLYMTATAMIQTATALPPTVVPPSGISDVAMPPQSMLERANFCTTTIRTTTDVLSLPSSDGVVIGALPPGTVVAVIDTQVFPDDQQTAVLWYFVAAQDVQGWVSVYTLEAPVCPQSQSGQMTPTPAPFAIVEATPAPFSAEPTVIPPVLVPVTSTPIPTPTLAR